MRSDQLDILQEFKSCDRIVPAHSHLYRAGERLNEIYNLLSGWVALYRILESGRRQILQIELPGAFLGYQARIDEPMLHSAECITDVAVCVFPRRAFPDLLDRHPVLGLKLAGIMAQDVVRTHDQLTNVGGRSGMERVAHFLLQLYLRLRHRQPALGGDSLALPLTQEMIGDALGLTPVHINRILRQLRERRLVVLHNKTLQVLDLEGLRRMAEVPQLDPAEL
ncbi:MAG TPA: Crp/Fnr family transcriptional regulator [Hypericibacter adhaerens]|uniref:Crp/Fnr family transcriptional regulator n=1 Tax=Hypericibacter adhaerens TaxID=2602016 RepID=UPI00177CE050|nr:Crp/Fnr family transcriptional regulator [Hypericibacter adhaerens]HWA46339.1 Crp/Fnr family transcriptional regulator [Hypericibacter adhaerens]